MSVLAIKRVFQAKGIIGTILVTGFTNIAVLVLTFLISILTARILGVEGRGELTAIIFWPTLMTGLIGFGLPTSIIYHLKQDQYRANDYFRVAIAFLVPAGLAAGAVAYVGLPLWLEGYSDTAVTLAQIYSILSIPLLLINSILSAIFKSFNKFNVYNGIVVSIPLLNAIGLTTLWLVGYFTLVTSTIVYILSLIVVVGYAVWASRKYVTMGLTFNSLSARPLFGYGIKVFGMDVLGTLYGQADKLIIVSMLTSRDLGLYAVVFSLSRIFNSVQLAITDVLFPKVTGMDPDKIITMTSRAFRISTMLMLIIFVPSMIVGRVMLELLFGPEFADASPTFYLLCLECIFGGSSWILASSFNAIGRPGLVLFRQIIAITVNVVLFFIFAPLFGLIGIALALLTGSLVRLLITLVQIPRVFKIRLSQVLYDKNDLLILKKIITEKIRRKSEVGL